MAHAVIPILTTALLYLRTLFLLYSSTIFLVPVFSVLQERKIWNSTNHTPSLSLFAHFKLYIFNVLWMGLTYVGSLCLLPLWVMRGFGASVERDAHCLVERMSALVCISTLVGPVVVRGAENLPPEQPAEPGRVAPVYVANHASQIDVGVVYYLFRRFKWIAKKSVLYIPGVGQTMFLGGHVFIDRKTGKNKSSVSTLYAKSNKAVQSGIPMFFFPQGTRRMAERLPFKDGAFNVALENKSPIVPVSIEIPLTAWNDYYPLSLLWGGKVDPVILTVHKVIKVTGNEEKEALKKQCFDVVYSVLPNLSEISGEKAKEKGS